MPGGWRPIEQLIAFAVILVATIYAMTTLPYNALIIFGVGIAVEVVVIGVLNLIKFDGVPILHKVERLVRLFFDRKPILVAAEELDRQVAANPHAFLVTAEGDEE